MTIVKQMRLFDIHELMEMESSRRFDAILATFDLQPIFQLFRKTTMYGAPRELNYGAMVQSLVIRIVERIPTVKDLVKRLKYDILFRLDCGFLLSDCIPSEASYSRMVSVISGSDAFVQMNDKVIQIAFTEGFLTDEHITEDATHFEARDAAKPTEKTEKTPKKCGRKSKEEREAWLLEQAEILKFTRPKECAICPLGDDSLCQKVFKIKCETDIRKYTSPARGSDLWKQLYKERSAVERVNAYLKEYFQLDNVRHRSGKKAKLHFQMVMFIYNACKLATDRLNAQLNKQQHTAA